MQARSHHVHSLSETVNHRAQLARAYQGLGKELSSTKIRLLGNYTLGKVIGEGTYGKVRIGTHRLTSTRVAIKQIPKEMSAQLTREIHHHRRLHHAHVTQLYEVLATENSIWLVTELCSGGELFDYLAEKGRLSEEETKKIFGQLCLATHYIHESGAVHRDLKLENVLLDDRCNVKIGDFGFTREFEHGRLLDTFCGTTGYAAPEMLLGQKYSGPEVDIWSLGIILHCLLTGTLPFDDDDEDAMKAKIIAGIYEEPEWLSDSARQLIRGILQKAPGDRITIPRILAHPWFAEDDPAVLASPPPLDLNSTTAVPSQDGAATTHDAQPQSSKDLDIAIAVSDALLAQIPPDVRESSESSSTTSDAQHSGISDDNTDLTSVTTPDARSSPDVSTLPLEQAVSMLDAGGVSRSDSQSTLGPKHDTVRTQPASKLSLASRKSDSTAFAVVVEEGEEDDRPRPTVSRNSSLKGKPSAPPSAFPARTPARTKRRSVSSNNISAPTSPTEQSFPAGTCAGPVGPRHYASLLPIQAPLLFSTPLERNLLSNLSALGFDTGQIVHSVLTDACDSNGALWWLLKKKAERREIAEERRVAQERRKTLEALDDTLKRKPAGGASNLADTSLESMLGRPPSLELSAEGHDSPLHGVPAPLPLPSMITKKDDSQVLMSTPQISFVPPTPNLEITPEPHTPPNQTIPSSSSAATLSADLDGSLRSNGSTPSTPGTPKEKKNNSKPRTSSVSMLQRAAGLVRKKSEEKVKEREDNAESSTAASSKLSWGRASESTAHSHSSASAHSLSHSKSFPSNNKLTKSPPSGKGKEKDKEVDHSSGVQSSLTPESPWTSVDPAQTPTQRPHAPRQVFKLTSPSFLSTHDEDKPTESFSGEVPANLGAVPKGRTQRASIFNTFRMWFQEDRKKAKGKGKALAAPLMQNHALVATPSSPSIRSRQGTYKSAKKRVGGFGHNKRPSVSSRRSSSVNSRRSSVTSIPPQRRPSDFIVPPLSPDSMQRISRQRSDASRRSRGSRTPSSEVGSRPSSIRSFNRTPRPRPARTRSPSQSSTGSSRARQATSPLYHRRLGSGSSSRVVRQVHMAHARSNSQASSTRSSRHNSLDLPGHSPLELDMGVLAERSITPVRERRQPTTVFVAHKQNNVFGTPSARLATHGRNSWKKSWGAEPPSWQSRTTHAPLETFSDGGSIRDVFTGRASLDPDDEDEWVDEEDDGPAFVGGLGQLPALAFPGVTSGSMPTSALPPSPSLRTKRELPPLMGAKSRSALAKRNRPTSAPAPPRSLQVDNSVARSATLRASPTPPLLALSGEPNSAAMETAHLGPGPRARRQMQGGRSGPAFKHPIQEEDEDEEE